MATWNDVLLAAIQHKCKCKGWNKERIAKECGIHIRQLQRYLKGERIPSVKVFFLIVVFCGWHATFEVPAEKFTI
jgi:transcriptional regulator with XRE-family HTH domain